MVSAFLGIHEAHVEDVVAAPFRRVGSNPRIKAGVKVEVGRELLSFIGICML
jgi:hypothetical protein